MNYVCVCICYTAIHFYTYILHTCLPRGLSFRALSLDQEHLDPWLEKLTCERALTGSTLQAKNSNLFFFFRCEPNLSGKLPRAVCEYVWKSNTYQPSLSVHETTIPMVQTSIRYRKTKNHKVNSWSIAVPAARLFHVTVMVETRSRGTSLLIHVWYIQSTVL
jgi:hypothetical protein